MITLKLSGGLGNQMFQYAAAYALAIKNNTSLTLDLTEFALYDLRSYMLDGFTLPSNVSTHTPKNAASLFSKLKRRFCASKHYNEPHFHYDPEFLKLESGATVKGYFQSQRYFEGIADEIRAHFTLKAPLSKSAQKMESEITAAKHAVSLHMRRGDYVSDAKTQATHGSVSENYYKQAVEIITKQIDPDVKLFIFSDDPEYAKNAFPYIQNKAIIHGNPDIPHEDMILMSRCDHHILANSSFSWWGAWLNPSPNKTIIAPKNWFSEATMREKSTVDLLPKSWTQI